MKDVLDLAIRPDGKGAVFIKHSGPAYELWIGSLTGADLHHYHEAPFEERFITGTGIAMSTNGEKIAINVAAISGPPKGKAAICIVPSNGGAPPKVVPHQGRVYGIIWLPDNRNLIVSLFRLFSRHIPPDYRGLNRRVVSIRVASEKQHRFQFGAHLRLSTVPRGLCNSAGTDPAPCLPG
jgi:hypothetical protein